MFSFKFFVLNKLLLFTILGMLQVQKATARVDENPAQCAKELKWFQKAFEQPPLTESESLVLSMLMENFQQILMTNEANSMIPQFGMYP